MDTRRKRLRLISDECPLAAYLLALGGPFLRIHVHPLQIFCDSKKTREIEPVRGSETCAHDILHHTVLVNNRQVVCERYPIVIKLSPFLFALPRTQKSNKSIGDRRNPRETSINHLKTSISSRLSSLLSFFPVVPFKRSDIRCL